MTNLLDSDEQNVEVWDLVSDLQISAFPLGHGGLVENVERECVAQVLDNLNPKTQPIR